MGGYQVCLDNFFKIEKGTRRIISNYLTMPKSNKKFL
jgi:hypothetical protein